MIEIITREYLETNITEPIYMVIPADPPEKYVVIEKTGESEENHIKTATLAVQSYADSMYDAMMLSSRVVDALKNMIERGDISAVSATDYNYTDTTTKKFRYQATCEVVYFE